MSCHAMPAIQPLERFLYCMFNSIIIPPNASLSSHLSHSHSHSHSFKHTRAHTYISAPYFLRPTPAVREEGGAPSNAPCLPHSHLQHSRRRTVAILLTSLIRTDTSLSPYQFQSSSVTPIKVGASCRESLIYPLLYLVLDADAPRFPPFPPHPIPFHPTPANEGYSAKPVNEPSSSTGCA